MESVQCSQRLIRGLRSLSRVRSPKTNHNRIGVSFSHRQRIGTTSSRKDINVGDIPSNKSVKTPYSRYDRIMQERRQDVEKENPFLDEGSAVHSDEASPGGESAEGSAVHSDEASPGGDIVEQPAAEGTLSVRSVVTDPGDYAMIKSGKWRTFDPIFLRDSCTCFTCLDPSTKQKKFQTTDIPDNILAKSAYVQKNGKIRIEWFHDIPGINPNHSTVLPADFFKIHANRRSVLDDRYETSSPKIWDKEEIESKLEYVNYKEYMSSIKGLYIAIRQLHYYGLLLIREVPDSEESVNKIAERIGSLRDTFYGRTWDVKSVPQARNVAYTSQYLGLHMDLLYMANPPGFQFLHCLKNTCEGGVSLFSDAFQAASKLSKTDYNILTKIKVPYHYRNAGEHYYYRHPVLERRDNNLHGLAHVNYSPPFQANLQPGKPRGIDSEPEDEFGSFLQAFKRFATHTQSKENLFEYRLQRGECVIFNNRRVLHGRRQFDTSQGERWLKGAYIDTDSFMSRWRMLREGWKNKKFQVTKEDSKFVFDASSGRPDGEWDSSIEHKETIEESVSAEEEPGNNALP